jgi:ribonuclease T1
MFTRTLSTWIVISLLALTGWLAGFAPPAHAQRGPGPAVEAAPGIAWIDIADIPPEARDTLRLIKAGGPFPYEKDGTRFGNRERVLPARPPDHYTEYTVRTPGERTRGARRIVAGADPRTSGEYYYTDDHYKSFRRIRESPTGRQNP